MVAHQGFLVKPLEKSDLNDGGGGGGENIEFTFLWGTR